MYIDKLELYLDKIDGDSLWLFNTMFPILHYADGVVVLFKSGVGLQRLLNKLHEIFISSSLNVNLSRPRS